VKATVYLTDLSLFPRVNAIYAEAFSFDPAPARVTVGVAALPLGAQVEIDAVALVS
jgi:2-iminobutanoate/2-iminopropanoate deaminase